MYEKIVETEQKIKQWVVSEITGSFTASSHAFHEVKTQTNCSQERAVWDDGEVVYNDCYTKVD